MWLANPRLKLFKTVHGQISWSHNPLGHDVNFTRGQQVLVLRTRYQYSHAETELPGVWGWNRALSCTQSTNSLRAVKQRDAHPHYQSISLYLPVVAQRTVGVSVLPQSWFCVFSSYIRFQTIKQTSLTTVTVYKNSLLLTPQSYCQVSVLAFTQLKKDFFYKI